MYRHICACWKSCGGVHASRMRAGDPRDGQTCRREGNRGSAHMPMKYGTGEEANAAGTSVS